MVARNLTKNPPHIPRRAKQNYFTIRCWEWRGGAQQWLSCTFWLFAAKAITKKMIVAHHIKQIRGFLINAIGCNVLHRKIGGILSCKSSGARGLNTPPPKKKAVRECGLKFWRPTNSKGRSESCSKNGVFTSLREWPFHSERLFLSKLDFLAKGMPMTSFSLVPKKVLFALF